MVRQDSLVMGMHNIDINRHPAADNDYGVDVRQSERLMDSPPAMAVRDVHHFDAKHGSLITDHIEVWDYVGGNRFRGFVAESEKEEGEKTMFVFFDQNVIHGKVKAGLMALLELCELSYFSCTKLVLCIDRETERSTMDTLVKDLGWIGFKLTTLNDFSEQEDIVSDKWLFMGMET